VKYPQHDQTLAIESILEHVGRAENLQYDLAVFFATGNWPAQLRVDGQHLHLVDNFRSYNLG
jgi:hypothetical protein